MTTFKLSPSSLGADHRYFVIMPPKLRRTTRKSTAFDVVQDYSRPLELPCQGSRVPVGNLIFVAATSGGSEALFKKASRVTTPARVLAERILNFSGCRALGLDGDHSPRACREKQGASAIPEYRQTHKPRAVPNGWFSKAAPRATNRDGEQETSWIAHA
jgi:hypothetical protein